MSSGWTANCPLVSIHCELDRSCICLRASALPHPPSTVVDVSIGIALGNALAQSLDTGTNAHINRRCHADTQVKGFKEVIQPQVPLRLPCYDFVPVMNHTVVTVLPKVKLATSGAIHSHDVTGGVYKARERIHRDILIRDY